mgnify:CR=1 FL=1
MDNQEPRERSLEEVVEPELKKLKKAGLGGLALIHVRTALDRAYQAGLRRALEVVPGRKEYSTPVKTINAVAHAEIDGWNAHEAETRRNIEALIAEKEV